MAVDQDEEWQRLWTGVKEFAEWFPDGMILIGGLAVWLHGQDKLDKRYLEISHDADLLLSLADYADLRDIEEVTRNRRLNKHQVIKNQIDFDLYIEEHNDLSIPYIEADQHACRIGAFRVLALEHLLVLKCDAALARTGAKGEKDLRDLLRIVTLLDAPDSDRFAGRLAGKRIKVLHRAGARTDLFNDLTGGNRHEAAKIRRRFEKNLELLENIAQNADDRSPHTHP